MDNIELVFLSLIVAIALIAGIGWHVDESRASLCNDLGFVYVDRQCIDAKVISIEPGKAAPKGGE